MKILIIGAAGMLGHQMWKTLNYTYPNQVFGTVRKSKSNYLKYSFFDPNQLIDDVDVMKFHTIEKTIYDLRPKWIINCVGITLRKNTINDFEQCIEINSLLPQKLSILAKKNEAKLIHFSTDCVFDGKKGNYTELDLPTANDLYGKSKFLGETKDSSSLTLRLSIIGRELENKTELVEWFLSQKGKEVKGYTNAIYSGLTTNFVAKEVARLIELNRKIDIFGTYQVASPPISKFDLLQLLNKHFKTNTVIEPFGDYKSDKSLDFSKYQALTGYVPPTWEKMIEDMASDTSYTDTSYN